MHHSHTPCTRPLTSRRLHGNACSAGEETSADECMRVGKMSDDEVDAWDVLRDDAWWRWWCILMFDACLLAGSHAWRILLILALSSPHGAWYGCLAHYSQTVVACRVSPNHTGHTSLGLLWGEFYSPSTIRLNVTDANRIQRPVVNIWRRLDDFSEWNRSELATVIVRKYLPWGQYRLIKCRIGTFANLEFVFCLFAFLSTASKWVI